jgi:hypothetical protein
MFKKKKKKIQHSKYNQANKMTQKYSEAKIRVANFLFYAHRKEGTLNMTPNLS